MGCDINQRVLTDNLQCSGNTVSVSLDGSKIVLSGTDENNTQRTEMFTLHQALLKALKMLSFEQAFIITRAVYAMRTGTTLDLSNSPQLLDIFNQIDPIYRNIIKQCFGIKTD